MKFTLSWLKKYLDTDLSPNEIADKLTAIGLEIDEVVNYQEKYKDFSVAKVLKRTKHPNADKLGVCLVETKFGEKELICGATNVTEGMKAVFAPEGTYIPGSDMVLKPVSIRGIKSSDMLCSAMELDLGEDHDGIIELDDSANVGDPVSTHLNLDEVIFDIDLTPNRADCLGVYGIARDLAAAGAGTLKPYDIQEPELQGDCSYQVDIDLPEEAKDACSAFAYCLVENVNNVASPECIQKQLQMVGLRPISALVDVTNLLTIDCGRPLHVFDADKLKGALKVRLSKQGETLQALDEKEYKLDDTMTIIADDSGVLALGGIMGGESTAVDENTKNVLIECAAFDPDRTARTGRKLGVHSDARFRFERFVDPQSILPGMKKAIELIQQFCGGSASEIKLAGDIKEDKTSVTFRLSKVRSHCGLDIEEDVVTKILSDLGFSIDKTSADKWSLQAPSWRSDIALEEDILEEVIRIYGYDQIPTTEFTLEGFHPETIGWNDTQSRTRFIRKHIAQLGYLESVTFSFISEENMKLFDGEDKIDQLKIMNPISGELGYMRCSALPNLIESIVTNENNGISNGRLFEVGPIYEGLKPEDQKTVATAVLAKQMTEQTWQSPAQEVDFFDGKKDLYSLLEILGLKTENLTVQAEGPTYYHPGRVATISLGRNVIAYLGELHPQMLKKKGFKGRMVAYELHLDALPPAKKSIKIKPFTELSLQPVYRDFAFFVDKDVRAIELIKLMKSADKKFISDVVLFDLYEGKNIPEDKKSLALKVKLQPVDKTFTEDDLEDISNKIIAKVKSKLAAELRDH